MLAAAYGRTVVPDDVVAMDALRCFALSRLSQESISALQRAIKVVQGSRTARTTSGAEWSNLTSIKNAAEVGEWLLENNFKEARISRNSARSDAASSMLYTVTGKNFVSMASQLHLVMPQVDAQAKGRYDAMLVLLGSELRAAR